MQHDELRWLQRGGPRCDVVRWVATSMVLQRGERAAGTHGRAQVQQFKDVTGANDLDAFRLADALNPADICDGADLTPRPNSAPGPGSALPHLRRDWACPFTGLIHATSAFPTRSRNALVGTRTGMCRHERAQPVAARAHMWVWVWVWVCVWAQPAAARPLTVAAELQWRAESRAQMRP